MLANTVLVATGAVLVSAILIVSELRLWTFLAISSTNWLNLLNVAMSYSVSLPRRTLARRLAPEKRSAARRRLIAAPDPRAPACAGKALGSAAPFNCRAGPSRAGL